MPDDNIIDGEILETIVEAHDAKGSITEARSDRNAIPAASLTAEAFVDKVAAGVDPTTAAHQLGTSVVAMFRDKAISQKVSKLFDKYEASAAIRKRVIRARLMEIALEGTDKNAIAAAKLLGTEAEVGMFGNTSAGTKNSSTVAVQVNIGDETRKVLDSVEVIEETK